MEFSGVGGKGIFIDLNPVFPALPRMDDKTKLDVRYALIPPYSFVHIYWNSKNQELIYELEEPLLNEEEKEVLERIETSMREVININVLIEKTTEAMIDYIDKTSGLLISELNLKIGEETYKKIFYYLFRDFIGLNEIEPLMRDYFIEDIECNGINTPIYIIHRIYRNMKTNIVFRDVDYSANFVEKLAQRCGRYISYANPLLDGSLPDGSRINATYTTDITTRGPTFSVRKFTKVPWTPTQLIALNTLSPEMLAYFWLLIQYKCNILITGGTASGKTTLLNALAFFIPPEARVVSIEDSVTGNSKIIIRENGKIRNITIKEFVDKRIDAEVITLNEKGKTIFVKPSDYIKHKVKKDIYEIVTRTGRRIKVTKDHSLFCLGENGLAEVKPTEMEENKSFIAVPRILPVDGKELNKINLIKYLEIFKEDFICGLPIGEMLNRYDYKQLNVDKERYRWWKKNNIIKIEEFLKLNIKFTYDELCSLKIKSKNKSSIPVIFKVTPEFLEFCGLWLGDGSYDNYNSNSVILSNIDDECRNNFKKLAGNLDFNYSYMNDGEVSLRIHSTIFYKFMKYVLKFDGYSNTKKIPDFIFGLSNEQIKHFIKGYFSADGCIKKNEVSCSSQSYELLEHLQTLLLRFGIISRINELNRKDKCINLSVSSSENIEKFKKIGFMQERKNLKLNNLNKKSHHTFSDIIPLNTPQIKELNKISSSKLCWPYFHNMQNIGREYVQRIAPSDSMFNDLSHNDIFWDRVKSIEKISGEEIEVFDLSIPEYEKFLCNNIFVHNTREINLSRENWLPSVARTAIGMGKVGEVDLFALLRNSFRQNPDYVIVGEVRGKEAFVLFQGMASGHSSISTMHADSVDTVIKRLETPPIELSPTLVNILDVVTIMSHAIVKKQQTRKLRSIVEIVNVTPDGVALTNTPFIWNPSDDKFYFKKESRVFEKIGKRFGLTREEIEKEFELRTRVLFEMFKKRVFGFERVQREINEYYKNPKTMLAKYGLAG